MTSYLPLSHEQKHFFSGSTARWNHPALNVVSVFYIDKKFDNYKFKSTIKSLVQTHSILKARLFFKENILCQTFDETRIPNISVVYKNLTTSQRTLRDEVFNIVSQTRILLFSEPLWRVHVIAIGDTSFYVILIMHHAIVDAESVNILKHNLYQFYVQNQETKLESQIRFGYDSYILAQKTEAYRCLWSEAFAYWRDVLKEIPNLYNKKWSYSESDFCGNTISFDLTQTQFAALKGVAKSLKTTTFVCCLAAFQAALCHIESMNRAVVLVPVSLREDVNVNTVGPITNLVPVEFILENQKDVIKSLLKSRNNLLDALDHKLCPLKEIMQSFASSRPDGIGNISRSILVSTRLQSSSNMIGNTELPFCSVKYKRKFATFDLTANVLENNEVMLFQLEYHCSRVGTAYATELISFIRKEIFRIIELSGRNCFS